MTKTSTLDIAKIRYLSWGVTETAKLFGKSDLFWQNLAQPRR